MWSYELEKGKVIQPGTLLLAEPFMFDENFRRTVVLICNYNKLEGVVGLILNKPIDLRLTDVIDDFPPFKAKMYLGGPVGTDTLQFLHAMGEDIEGTVKLNDHLYWGGNFEQLRSMIHAGQVRETDVKFFLGYAGWAFEQLHQELRDNSWIVSRATHRHVFSSDDLNLWKSVMKEMGGIYETMAGYPESPILN